MAIQQKTRLLRLILMTCLGLAAPAVAQSTDQAANSKELMARYGGELHLIYLDRLRGPSLTSQVDPTDDDADADDGSNEFRTLGLARARLFLEAGRPDQAGLRFVLRPDVQAGANGRSQDFDARSGVPYRETKSLRLLDAYELYYEAGANLRVTAGVFEHVHTALLPGTVAPEFGLLAYVPQNPSGLRLSWSNRVPQPTRAEEVEKPLWSIELSAIRGHDERSETLSPSDKSYDIAPAEQEPYWGPSILANYRYGVAHAQMLLGYIESPAGTGRQSEFFGVVGVLGRFSILDRQITSGLEFRYVSERWQVEGTDISPLVQQSVSVRTGAQMTSKSELILGLHSGRSDRHADDTRETLTRISGLQADLAARWELTAGMRVYTTMSHEIREDESVGGEVLGGFVNSSGERRRTLRRVAIGLDYQFDSQI